jgi:hypothetical protein
VEEPPGLRSAPEIRDYLVRQMNLALRHPEMAGGETSIRLIIDHLLHTERSDEAWAEQARSLESRGAWTSAGVSGAFRKLIAGRYDSGTASVYSEFARARGWLEADRDLTAGEYDHMRTQIPAWTAHDHTLSDPTSAFGSPSVLLGGGNPRYGKTLGYLTARPDTPMIFFHLWNGADPGAGRAWPPRYDEAVLLAVRCGTGDFTASFTFTPEGEKRRPGGN